MSSAPMLLIDAGHTRIKFAAVLDNDAQGLPEILRHRAIMLSDEIPWQELEGWFSSGPYGGGLLVGSNPQAVDRLLDSWDSPLSIPQVLRDKSLIPVEASVQSIQKVGIDRLLNAAAANRLRKPGQTAILVDSGTAITVDAVSSVGTFCGGAILPGVRMGAQALHNYTSTLPELETGRLFSKTPRAIGRHTEEALESGLYWGHVGAVRELILRLRDELASFDKAKDSPSLILMTGGAAPLLKPHFSQASFEPHLALQGLAITATHLQAQDRL